MKTPRSKTLAALAATTALASFPVFAVDGARDPGHARAGGEHPAVIVARLYPAQVNDYGSPRYPSPDWAVPSTQAARPMMDHPAVAGPGRSKHSETSSPTTSEAPVLEMLAF